MNKEKLIKKLNDEIKNCTKCGLHTTRKNVVLGEGNLNLRLMLIAQAPGEKEDASGKMFVGPTGKVFDSLLKIAELKRDEIYMTNLIKCFLPHYRKPKSEEIKACGYFLDREIEILNPEIIVPLGYYATRYIFEKYHISLPSHDEFSKVYGQLIWTGEVKIYPLEHPSSLLYDDSKRNVVEEHYRKLKVLKRPCKWMCCCPMVNFYEKGQLERKWIELYCKGDWESCVRYQMEERGEYHKDCMRQDGKIIRELC